MPSDSRMEAVADHHCIPRDSVDRLVASWHDARPELEVEPVEVVARLARVRNHIDAELAAGFAASGLSGASFQMLVTLVRLQRPQGVTQRRLMDELGLTSGTISVRVDRLVADGLIERTADPDNKRNVSITLTDRGRELFERAAPAHLAGERRLLAGLSDAEQRLLADLLRKLLVEFEGSTPPDSARFRLGLVVAPVHVTIAMREAVGLPAVPGLLIRAVDEGGPGANARLLPGDVLVRAGRRELRSVASLYAAIADAATSGRLRLGIVRGIEQKTIQVALGSAAEAIEGRLAATAGRSARGEHTL